MNLTARAWPVTTLARCYVGDYQTAARLLEAGSGALMLLVLSTISSPVVGMSYILVFGIGSIGGMMLMSLLLSLPFHFTAKTFGGVELTMRGLAGAFNAQQFLLQHYTESNE